MDTAVSCGVVNVVTVVLVVVVVVVTVVVCIVWSDDCVTESMTVERLVIVLMCGREVRLSKVTPTEYSVEYQVQWSRSCVVSWLSE